MELNTLLCFGRSDLSGFNEGNTRRKLFPSSSPTPESNENLLSSQQSQTNSTLRSSTFSTPPKKSILRGQLSNSCQSSPSSLRSVRFSEDEDDFSVECTNIHVNKSTQTSEMVGEPDDNDKGTQTGALTGSGTRQSRRDVYIESVGSPKSHRICAPLGSSLTRGQEGHISVGTSTTVSNQMSKAAQKSLPRVPDGRKITQNMEITKVSVKEIKKPDGCKIIQNLEMSKNRSKEVQTEDIPTFVSEATQTPSVPDGNKIIQNMDIDYEKNKHANSATQTPAVPDGSKIIQNMALESPRPSAPVELVSRNIAVQTETQTPNVPDGRRIIKNMEVQRGEVDVPFTSISVQTNPEHNYGQRNVQNVGVERIRSPSPEYMDQSFGFEVNLSFASTQTNPEPIESAHKPDTDISQNEPVLIYNKTDTTSRPMAIGHNDVVGKNEWNSSAVQSVVTDVSDHGKLIKHSAKMLLERQSYTLQSDHQEAASHYQSQSTNTQTAGSKTVASTYQKSHSSIHEKLVKQSYSAGSRPIKTNAKQSSMLDMRADQWIAPTLPTKLRPHSPRISKRDTVPVTVKPNLQDKRFEPAVAQSVKVGTLPSQKWKFEPKMTSSVYESSHTGRYYRKVSPVAAQRDQYISTYETQATETSTRESKLETFSCTPIDVYSFDPSSVAESKKLLSQSKCKESVTKNTFIKGFDLQTSSAKTSGLTSRYRTETRQRTLDPYVQKVNIGRSRPTIDNKYSAKESAYSSRYSNLYRPRSTGSSSLPSYSSSYTSNYSRSQSASSARVGYKPNSGYRSSSLTPTLNQIRSTAIRKNSMNSSTCTSSHASRPSSGSSSGISYPERTRPDVSSWYQHERIKMEASAGYSRSDTTISSGPTSDHRSRSREKTRGTNSKVGQTTYIFDYTSRSTNKNKSPLYIDCLTDEANVRPRSKERCSKSKSPYSTERNKGFERSRSSSATGSTSSRIHVTRKPPLPQTIIRKPSPSPQRRSTSRNKDPQSVPNRHNAENSSSTTSFGNGSSITSKHAFTKMSIGSGQNGSFGTHSVAQSRYDTTDDDDLDPSKVTIGMAPSGLVDRDCVYLDEKTIQRIIESANL